MHQHEPSLNAIQSFAVTAKYLSFTTAANELCVSQGAVSRMVRKLEEDLGVLLFRRIGRGIELTAAGAVYYAEVSAGLDRILAATRSLRGPESRHLLTIGVLPTFAVKWLVPHLHSFQKAHPDIYVDLISKDGSPNVNADTVDICICHGRGVWNNIEAHLLFRESIGVFASPGFLQARHPITCPRQLKELPLLVHSTRPEAWNEFFAAFDEPPLDMKDVLRFEHFFMIIEAIVAGLGVALLPTFIAHNEVQAGRIVQLLPHVLQSEEGYYVAHPVGADTTRKIAVFRKWLLDVVKPAELPASIP